MDDEFEECIMDTIFEEFESYLFQVKKMAQNSLQAYRRDTKGFISFLRDKHIENFSDASNATIIAYLLHLKKEGRTTSTINRKIASVRALFAFLKLRGDVSENPVDQIKTPKTEKKTPEYISLEEVELLLSQPDDSIKGKRDKAILELMYATGMRVSEVVQMDVSDVNLKMSFAACGNEDGKGRVIPMGRICRNAMQDYLLECRDLMIKNNDEKALFVNTYGNRITRQGLWKMIKYYAEKAGIEHKITPQILRHSFAVHMIHNGADLKSLQELLGHEDAAATQVYLFANKNNVKEVYEKTHPRA